MNNHNKRVSADPRRLIGLAWVASRWGCSRQTCRRILQRQGVQPLFLGGEARNATLRFDLSDVLRVEAAAQGGGVGGSAGRER